MLTTVQDTHDGPAQSMGVTHRLLMACTTACTAAGLPLLAACGSGSSSDSADAGDGAGADGADASASPTGHVGPTVDDVTSPPKESGDPDTLPEIFKYISFDALYGRYGTATRDIDKITDPTHLGHSYYANFADLTVREIVQDPTSGEYGTYVIGEDGQNSATTPGALHTITPGHMVIDDKDEFGYVLVGTKNTDTGGKAETHSIDVVKVSLIDGTVSATANLWDNLDPKAVRQGLISMGLDGSAVVVQMEDGSYVALTTKDLSAGQEVDLKKEKKEMIGDYAMSFDKSTGYSLVSVVDGSTHSFGPKEIPLKAFGKWLYVGNICGSPFSEIQSVFAYELTNGTKVDITGTIPGSTDSMESANGMLSTRLTGDYLVSDKDVRMPGEATAKYTADAAVGAAVGDIAYVDDGDQKVKLVNISDGSQLASVACQSLPNYINHFGRIGARGRFIPATSW